MSHSGSKRRTNRSTQYHKPRCFQQSTFCQSICCLQTCNSNIFLTQKILHVHFYVKRMPTCPAYAILRFRTETNTRKTRYAFCITGDFLGVSPTRLFPMNTARGANPITFRYNLFPTTKAERRRSPAGLVSGIITRLLGLQLAPSQPPHFRLLGDRASCSQNYQ